MQQDGGASDDFGAVRIARVLPGDEAGSGCRKLGLQLRVTDFRRRFFRGDYRMG
jgi:hypothetical protein